MMVDFVEYDEYFLSCSWNWLHDDEIKYLTMTPDFTCEEQKHWFSTLKGRKDYLVWGILLDQKPIGACGLKHITESSGEYWGYIGEKEYWGQKIGDKMVKFIENEAGRLKLSEIYLRVLADNIRAVKLYKRLGYMQQGEDASVLYMKKSL